MKLMKKMALIFVSVTIISSIAFLALGNSIMKIALQAELGRGPGRANSALGIINSEVNKVISQTREFGEYFSIIGTMKDYVSEDKAKEITGIDKKIQNSFVPNMYILDDNFKVIKTIREENNIEEAEFEEIFHRSKELLQSEEFLKKSYCGGVLGVTEKPYIIALKKVIGKGENIYYTLGFQPIDINYINYLDKVTSREIGVVQQEYLDYLFKEGKLEEVDSYNNVFYCNRSETDSIETYVKFNMAGEGEDYYLRVLDNRQVKINNERNIFGLVSGIVIFTIFANVVMYVLIKKTVLERILRINKVVNEVSNGKDLDITIKENNGKDEIAVLASDLDNMFKRLKAYSDNLEFIGNHDILTNLMNRNKLKEYMNELINMNQEFAVMFIDLDNFKGINDTLGHKVGDELLCKIGQELSKTADTQNMVVARIGGDEFVIIKKGKNDKNEISVIAGSLLRSIHHIYEVGAYTYEIKASMGISFFPQDAIDDVTLLQYADVAMYCSKSNGGNCYEFFHKSMLIPLEIESSIKRALNNDELTVYYQPIYDINKGKVIGAEALVRWIDDDEVILPGVFIPVAKKTGYIADIDNYVFKQAIKSCKRWRDTLSDDFYISVNASKRFLKQNNIINFIEEELTKNNLPPSSLKIEITEDEIIDDMEYTLEILSELKNIGIKVSLDDFGVGYSSFNHIKTLPIDVVKMDRSLVCNIEDNIKDKAIVQTMINLCHSLNLTVTCEGVEVKNQVDILKTLNCDNIQGYYYSQPINKQEFEKFIIKTNLKK